MLSTVHPLIYKLTCNTQTDSMHEIHSNPYKSYKRWIFCITWESWQLFYWRWLVLHVEMFRITNVDNQILKPRRSLLILWGRCVIKWLVHVVSTAILSFSCWWIFGVSVTVSLASPSFQPHLNFWRTLQMKYIYSRNLCFWSIDFPPCLRLSHCFWSC